MTGQWRCDHLASMAAVEPTTTWHDDEDEALAEASRLWFEGRTWVVAWLDLAVYVPVVRVVA